MVLDLSSIAQTIAQKHAEFAELFETFANSHLDSEAGRAHIVEYQASRTQARDNFERILARQQVGDDVTDAVLDQLLPYADTPTNRAADRWIAAAPALQGDVRRQYEAAGWTDPADWPAIATAILNFIARCVAHPVELPDACADFSALPYTKGFQMGTISPILNALRPEHFVIVNGRSRRVINYFAGTAYRAEFTDYPDLNATGFALIDALLEDMHTLEVDDGLDVDLFHTFCDWLVAIRDYDFEAPEPEMGWASPVPFGDIFATREEADWALDLIHETLNHLGVDSPEDPRVALTWTHQGRTLRLNFGNWAILQFYGPCSRKFRVGLALREEHLDVFGPYDVWRPFSTQDDVRIRVYDLPMETVRPFRGSLRRSYERALDYVETRFRQWRASNYRRFHRPEIAAAVFDDAARARLFAEPFCEVTVEAAGAVKEPETTYAAPPSEAMEEVTEAPAPEMSLGRVGEITGFDVAQLEAWVAAMERKGQAILYGPPGTGKTYLAEMLARHLIDGADGFWDLVQFHPAYAYEDFVQGLRPQTDSEGTLTYEMEPGRLMEFCRRARRRTGRCVLIIDEINRADLSRVFGEVMYLLEYRDREIPLAGGGHFSIPDNVRILGTMNTADRSIALVDHALRRRFAFISVYPNYEVLRRYHRRRKTGFELEPLIELLQQVNRQIGDPNYHIGITFFLREDLDQHLESIWRMEIEPYLEELFFDQPDKVTVFRWKRVVSQIVGDERA